nr:MAG TPA: hypothetical protein [Caudoviricetes sp.]
MDWYKSIRICSFLNTYFTHQAPFGVLFVCMSGGEKRWQEDKRLTRKLYTLL